MLDNGPTLGEGHQTWQLNEINKLIWPNDLGIGVMNPDDFSNTAQIAIDYGVIKNEASSDAYIDTYAKAAVEALKADGADVNGAELAGADRRGDARAANSPSGSSGGRRRDTSAATRVKEGIERCPF